MCNPCKPPRTLHWVAPAANAQRRQRARSDRASIGLHTSHRPPQSLLAERQPIPCSLCAPSNFAAAQSARLQLRRGSATSRSSPALHRRAAGAGRRGPAPPLPLPPPPSRRHRTMEPQLPETMDALVFKGAYSGCYNALKRSHASGMLWQLSPLPTHLPPPVPQASAPSPLNACRRRGWSSLVMPSCASSCAGCAAATW